MASYKIAGHYVRSDSNEFGSLLVPLHGASSEHRALCMCTQAGVPMYVAKINERYMLKRLPNSGKEHSPNCDSYEPPAELSGLGQVMGSAIEENVSEGITMLKLDFSLSKSGSRTMPVPTGKEADSVTSKGTKLTLRGTLDYLWCEAGFNRWTPIEQNKRFWSRIQHHLVEATENKTTKGSNLADVLFVPETFNLDKKDEITQRRYAHLMRIAAPEKGVRKLMVVIGELKGIDTEGYSKKLILKHLPDYRFQLTEDLHNRFNKRFNYELSLWSTQPTSHLIIIATFGVNPVGVANIEEIAVMNVNENWIPYENVYDYSLLESLVKHKRKFIRGMRYNVPHSKPMAVAVLNDMGAESHALYITPLDASEDYKNEQRKMIEASDMISWVWDTTAGPMPALPQIRYETTEIKQERIFEKPLFSDEDNDKN